MIVSDTNVIPEIFRPRPDPQVLSWLELLTDDVAITTITLAELLAGVQRLPDGGRKTQLEAAVNAAVGPYRHTQSILAFDSDAATEYANVIAGREREGRPVSMADAQIAAICRVHGAICATRNTKNFTGTGIGSVNPWTA
ncbi:type II toxin-antitoxin system VapC family toxin [Enteractinococcus coprophilus]|uniref:Ribonuclease VapC n=1 Tax=Enteractinococcus coprophilus TaxID=1027633 RepID=A0A543ANH7_9MICC|nr:type II toxin-antitoxin system VapC family toxin [Enteractinococcus coprophilus]TQL74096.1 hypothetical protein FB556_0547 [Enteractinococcus coprophilus]